ncbi:unnamed protein product [Diplocarpon coronariae]
MQQSSSGVAVSLRVAEQPLPARSIYPPSPPRPSYLQPALSHPAQSQRRESGYEWVCLLRECSCNAEKCKLLLRRYQAMCRYNGLVIHNP